VGAAAAPPDAAPVSSEERRVTGRPVGPPGPAGMPLGMPLGPLRMPGVDAAPAPPAGARRVVSVSPLGLWGRAAPLFERRVTRLLVESGPRERRDASLSAPDLRLAGRSTPAGCTFSEIGVNALLLRVVRCMVADYTYVARAPMERGVGDSVTTLAPTGSHACQLATMITRPLWPGRWLI
jgi:hypothetical protein